MAWIFGDGFDLYQQLSDATQGYWSSGNATTATLDLSSVGRFTGSRGLTGSSTGNSSTYSLYKDSGSNDNTHHISVSYDQTSGLTGTNNQLWMTLNDGSSVQVGFTFRSDGAIVFYSGVVGVGSVIGTYSSAFTAINTWCNFEIEIVIHNTAGSIKVRKNGNTTDDFAVSSVNTRAGSTNAYANRLVLGNAASNAAGRSIIDDLLWRSDTSSVAWAGDIRCYTRLPDADSTITWTRSGSTVPVTPFAQGGTASIVATTPRYAPFVATASGTIGSAVLSLALGYTGNMKCTLFADASGPGSVLGSATAISNPSSGNNTFTFGTPVAVVRGTKYWIGFSADTAVTNGWNVAPDPGASDSHLYQSGYAATSSISYASFPTASPAVTANRALVFTAVITPTTVSNAMLVAEVAQDGTGTYLSDSNAGDGDLYTPQATDTTPSSVLAVTTRGLFQKSDAGARSAGVQLKSGGTTVQTAVSLGTSWGWVWRTDTVDPNTSAAWSAIAVNSVTFGPKLTV